MAANTPPPTPPNPDDPSGTWLTTDNWLNITPGPNKREDKPPTLAPTDSSTGPVDIPQDPGDDDDLVLIDDIPPPTLPHLHLPQLPAATDPGTDSSLVSRLIEVPTGSDPLNESATMSRLIDVPSAVWNKLNPPTANPPTTADDDELDLGSLPEIHTGGSSASFVSRVPKTEPIHPADDLPAAGPSSGWMPSGTKLPIPGSTADIDLPPNRHLADEPSDIFSTARRSGGKSDLFGGSGGAPSVGSPGSNIFSDPGRVSGGGSDIFASDPSRAATGGESDLFAGLPGGRLPGVDERGSSVHDDPARRTDKVEFTGPTPVQPSDRHGMVQLDLPDDRGGASDGIEVIDTSTLFSGRHLPPTDDLPVSDPLPAALPPLGSDSDPEMPDSDSDPNLDLDGVDKEATGSNLFGDATVLDMDLATGGQGLSGVNLLDPDAAGSGRLLNPRSSIFNKAEMEADQPDADHVDFASMPVMGSSDDERTESMLFPDAGPKSGIFDQPDLGPDDGAGSVTFDLPDEAGDGGRIPYQESGNIDYQADFSDDPAERTMAAAEDSGQLNLGALDSNPGERTARTDLDDESVFSAPSINPADYGIPELDDPPPPPVLPMSRAVSVATPGPIGRAPTAGRRLADPGTRPQPSLPPQTTGGAKRGGLLLAGIGLLAGGLLGAGGVYLGSGSPDTGKPGGGSAQVTPPPNPNPPAVVPADNLLAADPAAALAAFLQEPDGTASALGRGQARWLSRFRSAGGKRIAADDAELQQARTELKAALDAHEQLPPEQKILAARAGLHLGLIEEAVGDPDKAIAAYQSAAGLLPPQFKKVFDSAIQRVRIMMKGADNRELPKDQYSLLAAESADDLATAVLFLTFDPVQEIEDEPGFHFWEAVGHSAAYLEPVWMDKAIQSLDKARQAHADRRKKYAGRGLNPMSDPSEQMFLRACDELKFYWAFKRDLYKDPVVAELARNGKSPGKGMNTGEVLAALVAAKKAGGSATTGVELTALKERTESLTKELTAQKDATRLAEEKRDAAIAASKAADAAVDAVVAKLKESKLIDDKLDRVAAVAALPDALKKAMTPAAPVPVDAQMKKLVDELAAAKKAEEVAKAEAKKAADERDIAMKANGDEKVAAAVKIAVEKAKAEAKSAAEEQVAAARLVAEAATARASKEAAESAKLQQKLQEQADRFAADITAVRAGASVRIGDAERATAERGARWYAEGVTAYFAGQYGNAEASLATAVKESEADARAWYFLGLSKLAVGRTTEADADFRTGAKWEAAMKPGRRAVSSALERVQGGARATVEGYRP